MAAHIVCKSVMEDILTKVLGEEQTELAIKPVFVTKRPAEPRMEGPTATDVNTKQRKMMNDPGQEAIG